MIINPITVTFSRHELEAVRELVRKALLKSKKENRTLEFADDRLSAALKRARADAQLATLEGV